MSYRCEDCWEAVTWPNRVIVETRLVQHEPRTYKRRRVAPEQSAWIKDPGGPGTQIVREANLCGKCAARHQPSQPGPVATA